MPQFKSTYNIMIRPDQDEVFDPNWMDSDELILPPKTKWSYDREMTIEDVDIWEVMHESSGGIGLYVSWSPYAEFYLLTTGWHPIKEGQWANDRIWETFYGQGAQHKVINRIKELGLNQIKLKTYNTWVDQEDLWLHQKPVNVNLGKI
jgi:hypothetical protein